MTLLVVVRVRHNVCMANGLTMVIVVTNLPHQIVRKLNKVPVFMKIQLRSGDHVFSNN